MKRLSSIIPFSAGCLLFLMLVSTGQTADKPAASEPAREKLAGILKSKCLKCHGEKKVKGDLNLVAMLERKLVFDDVADWGRVFSEVQNGNMPPEEEDSPLAPAERKHILSVLQAALGKGGSSRRMITPGEYKNAIADLYQLDLKNYDPIGDLNAFVSPEHQFHTVQSNRMMNRFYLSALMGGTERILREHTSDNEPLVGKARDPNAKPSEKQLKKTAEVKAKRLKQRRELQAAVRNAATPDAKRIAEKKLYDSQQGRLEGEIARRTPKSTNYTKTFAFPMKMSPKIKDTTDGFFEYTPDSWGIRGKSWIGNNNMPIMLLGGYSQQFRILPPGKYRLTIRASAKDRESIATVPHVRSEDTAWSNNKRLATEACKLVVYKDANRTKTKSDPLTRATPVGFFYIKDDKVQDYTMEVAFHWNTQLGVLFENGVTNVIKAGVHPVMRYDENDQIVYVKSERKLPMIWIHDVTLEKIGDLPRGRLFIDAPASFDDAAAKEKIETFISMTGLDESPKFIDFYQALQTSGASAFEAYVDTLQWLFVTADYLYIDGESKSPKGRLRHASFSLLKTVPSPAFAESFEKYQSGEWDSKKFTDALVKAEGFGDFAASFSSQWLELSEIDQNAPDRAKFPAFYDDDLKVDLLQETASYIQYLFTDNRKLSELVASDYHFLNDRLALLYGIRNVRHHDIRKVASAGPNGRIGILSHASFMIANANGVEDLPFKRSKWISENILDKRVPPPPNEIDVTAFGKSEGKDFPSRIKAHINNAKCNDCHRLLDTMAIDLHPFDLLGQIKAHDGFTAAQAEAHRKSLKAKASRSERKLASAFSKNLLTFIKGSELGINDLLILDDVLNDAEDDGYRARDILQGIVGHYFPRPAANRPAGDVEIIEAKPMVIPGDSAADFLEGPSVGDGVLYYSQRLGKGAERKALVRGIKLDAPDEGAFTISSFATGGTWYHKGSLTAVTAFKDGGAGLIRFSLQDGKKPREPEVLVKGKVDGRELIGPNDLVRDAHGGFYFTDKKGKAIYYLAADGKASLVTAYIDDGDRTNDAPEAMDNPNGIILSPDGSTLYVTDNSNILHAPILKPGKLAKNLKHLLPGEGIIEPAYHEVAEIKPLPSPNSRGKKRFQGRFGNNMNIDGMTVDADGVVYGAGLSTGIVFGWDGKTGKLVRLIKCPGSAINCTIGGENHKTLFVVGGGVISIAELK